MGIFFASLGSLVVCVSRGLLRVLWRATYEFMKLSVAWLGWTMNSWICSENCQINGIVQLRMHTAAIFHFMDAWMLSSGDYILSDVPDAARLVHGVDQVLSSFVAW